MTARAWLSILEMSYLVFRLQPYYKNFSKRLIKSPKLFFYDTGLACYLLGIESPEQLQAHYLRGGLFESFVISELMKQQYNKAFEPHVYFWRDKHGHEVDCLLERGTKVAAIEIKASTTIASSFFDGLSYWQTLTGSLSSSQFVVYAGQENQKRSKGEVRGWKAFSFIADEIK